MMTLIRFTLVSKKRPNPTVGACWIKSVSYKPGPGMQVSKMQTTRNRDEAARFSLATAYDIAVQFSQFPAILERADGQILEAETRKLQDEQCTRHETLLRQKAEINREFNELLSSASKHFRETGMHSVANAIARLGKF